MVCKLKQNEDEKALKLLNLNMYIEIREFREYEIWLQAAFFIKRGTDLNPIKGDVSDSQLNAGVILKIFIFF